MQKKLLIMTDWFYPGFKGGGIITSCYNLTMLLKKDYLIYILTSDRDLGDQVAYESVIVNVWRDFCENVQIYYASPEKLNWRSILKQIRQLSPYCIYLNSMYSLFFTIYPLIQKKIGLIKAHIVLTPSGMLKGSALEQKAFKKQVYLKILCLLKIQRSLTFHATDETENREIINVFGKTPAIRQIYCAPPFVEENISLPQKVKGSLNLVFVGRIHSVKNLHYIIECLMKIDKPVRLTIIGQLEDETYYNRCKQLEHLLSENISVHYTGGIPNEGIKKYLRESHFLVHPSLGENYCYAIVEAFCQGRPAIISNNTPWHNMEAQKIGWDLPLSDQQKFIDTINRAANMDQDEYNEWCIAAWKFAQSSLKQSTYKDQYIKMFNQVSLA